MKREWKKRMLEVEMKRGVREKCWLVKVKGKDGKEVKMVMREVDVFWGEEDESEEEDKF